MKYGLKEPSRKGMFLENKERTAQEGLDWILQDANSDAHGFHYRWLSRIHTEGITATAMKEITELMAPLSASAVPVIDRISLQLRWELKGRTDWNQQLQELHASLDRYRKHLERWNEQREDGHLLIRRQAQRGEISREFAEALISDDLEDAQLERENLRAKERSILEFRDAIWAHNLAYLISDGVFDYLRICQRPECENFYIGGPRSRWCSDNCGSIVRVKRKRKRDKAQGAMI